MITSESIKAEDIFDVQQIKEATSNLEKALKQVEYAFKSADKAAEDAIVQYNKFQQILKDHNNVG